MIFFPRLNCNLPLPQKYKNCTELQALHNIFKMAARLWGLRNGVKRLAFFNPKRIPLRQMSVSVDDHVFGLTDHERQVSKKAFSEEKFGEFEFQYLHV